MEDKEAEAELEPKSLEPKSLAVFTSPGWPRGSEEGLACSASLSEFHRFLDVTNTNWSRVKG